MNMNYRCVGCESFNHTFTLEDYMRYQHNINMLHWRTYRTSEILLRPVDVTEDTDDEEGFVRGYKVECTQKVDETYLLNLDKQAQEIKGWIIADISRSIYYMDSFMSTDWVSRIVRKILGQGQVLWNDYVVEEIVLGNWLTPVPISMGDEDPKGFEDSDVEDLEGDEEKYFYEIYLRNRDPRKLVASSYIKLLDTLLELYNEGTIGDVDSQFVSDWELEENKTYKGLYHPLWTNTLVAPNKSNYLTKVAVEGKPKSYRDATTGPLFDFFGRVKCPDI